MAHAKQWPAVTEPGERSRAYEGRRAKLPPGNNSVDRAYDLLLSEVLRGRPGGLRLIEEQLVAQLSASRTTVRRVLSILTTQGLITRGRKVGTCVPTPPLTLAPDLRSLASTVDLDGGCTLRELRSEDIATPPAVRGRLGAACRDSVTVVEGPVHAGLRRVGMIVAYLVPSENVSLPPTGGTGIEILRFLDEPPAPIASVHIRMALLPCAGDAGSAWGIDPDHPLIWIENEMYDELGDCRALITITCDASKVAIGPLEAGGTLPQGAGR